MYQIGCSTDCGDEVAVGADTPKGVTRWRPRTSVNADPGPQAPTGLPGPTRPDSRGDE
jgi:hypothetical protein